jgi:hypothetical protein
MLAGGGGRVPLLEATQAERLRVYRTDLSDWFTGTARSETKGKMKKREKGWIHSTHGNPVLAELFRRDFHEDRFLSEIENGVLLNQSVFVYCSSVFFLL